MSNYLLDFREIDQTKLALVGGKGANLGELSKLEGVPVPRGFCLTTEAYKEVTGSSVVLPALLDRLALLEATDRKEIGETSKKIRQEIEELAIPERIADEIARQLEHLDEKTAYAVRSSVLS